MITLRNSLLCIVLLLINTTSYASSTNLYTQQSNDAAFAKALQAAPLLYLTSSTQSKLKLLSLKEQTYQLTLKDVDSSITYFTNRPARLTGKLPMKEFINYWQKGDDSFAKVPPNAAFTATTVDNSKQVSYVFSLSNITYDPSIKTLKFIVKVITPGIQQDLAQNLSFSNLFIDFNWHGNIP